MKPNQETNASGSSELPGFENVNLESINETTLSSEDLESCKKQLWLIKVPYEFDVSKLSGTTVVLNGSQDLTIKQDDEKNDRKYESRAAKYGQNESCHYKMVVPSKTKGCLNVAKDFTGHMDIIQTVKVPMLNYPSAPPPMYTDIPKGLKPRWKPFGHRTPPKINKRKMVEDDKSLKVREKRKRVDGKKGESHESPKKKKKKKKTKNESGYGSALQLDDSSSSTKHKKKKKKRHS